MKKNKFYFLAIFLFVINAGCASERLYVRVVDNDGKPEYTTPYELRAVLATKTLDLSVEENRFAVGRALYHIAQRRGFKSSKGETLKNQEKDSTDIIDISESLIKSEKEKDGYISICIS